VTKYRNPKDQGMEDIQMVLSERYGDTYVPQKKKIVGKFIGGDGAIIYWVVSDRPDRRHGTTDTPVPSDPYCKSLFEGMFKKWGSVSQK
jgi:hypothetical protein